MPFAICYVKWRSDWHTEKKIPGTMRGLLIPSTQNVLIWEGWYAPHGYITDRFNFQNGFHLILTADKITVLTLWRYERAGFDREAVEELVRTNPYLKRMYRNQVEIVIET